MKGYSVIVLLLAAMPAPARDIQGYLMPEDEELRLAATAGPPVVTERATYYVLTETGFRMRVEGDNGWHCFVERAFFVQSADEREYDPRVRAPHCINAEGARTRMQEVFLRAELALGGGEREEVDAAINAAFESGALRPPAGFALTYMMSPEQWLGEGVEAWHPHLMVWVPYLENDDVGGNPPMGVLPFIAGDSGTRSAVLIIPVAPLPSP